MPKYDSLAIRLEEDSSSRLAFTFAEIGEMVGGLPASAYRHRAWWANDEHHVQARAWNDAGYKVESVDLNAQIVTFAMPIPECTAEEVEGFLTDFYSKHDTYDYGDVTALNFALDWLICHEDPRTAMAQHDKSLFGSIALGEHDKGKRFALGRGDVDEGTIAYYADRAERAADITHRAVYGDFLLNIGHRGDRAQLLARTIDAYLNACDDFVAEGAYMLLGDAIAQTLALSATSMETHLPRTAAQARNVLTVFAKRSDGIALRSLRELLGWLIRKFSAYRDHIPPSFVLGVIERALVTCDNNHFDNKEQGGLTARPLYEDRHQFLDLAVKLTRKIQDDELARHYQRRGADSHVAEAEWWATNGMGDAAYRTGSAYQDAAKAYTALGHAAKAEQYQRLMQEAFSEMPRTGIRLPSSVQPEEITTSLARYIDVNPADAFALLASESRLCPSLAEYQRGVSQGLGRAPILEFLGIESLRDSLPAGTAETRQEKVWLHAVNLLLGEFHIAVKALLVPVLDYLATDSIRFIGEMRERLEAAGFPSTVRIVLCTNGVASYARGDYIAAVHTLVPQVEGMLRDLTVADGTHHFTYRRTTTREEMDRVLLRPLIDDLRGYRPEDAPLFDLLEVLLNDLLGDNLRNVVAHAFGDKNTYDKENAATLILLLIRISFMDVRRSIHPRT